MDLNVEHLIHAAPAQVAKVMFDPAREPEWIPSVHAVALLTPGPLAVGSRLQRDRGGLFAHAFNWVTEVIVLEPDHRLEMNVIEGPIFGTIVYEVGPTAGGSVAIVHGRARVPVFTPWAAKRTVSANLKRLARLVHAAHADSAPIAPAIPT